MSDGGGHRATIVLEGVNFVQGAPLAWPRPNRRAGSDHWPIRFGSLQAAAEPVDLTIHADHRDRLLDGYQGQTNNGTHVIQYHANGGANQQWYLSRLHPPFGEAAPPHHQHGGQQVPGRRQRSELPPGRLPRRLGLPPARRRTRRRRIPPRHPELTLEHPNAARPDDTLLRSNATGLYVNINRNETGDGARVIQWPDQFGPFPAPNETFYLHPVVE